MRDCGGTSHATHAHRCGTQRQLRAVEIHQCESRAVAVDLSALAARIHEREEDWNLLAMTWTVGPIHANYGKPMAAAEFESADMHGEILLWVTGEAELESMRLSDFRVVNKHYALGSASELDSVFADLIALARDGVAPADGVIAYASDQASAKERERRQHD
jgi:hypothetical protein